MKHHRSCRHGTFLRSTVLLALLLAACNLPRETPASPLPTETPGPADTRIPEPTPTFMGAPMPSPTPMPSEQVWFGPNMGSQDFPDLFTKSEQWSEARSRIKVLKFFPQNLVYSPSPLLGDNTLNAFVRVDAFRKLMEWGIAIDIDVGAVKEWGCGKKEFRQANEAIQNVLAHGGVVTILDMDEPFMGGELVANGLTCGFTMEQTADATARFVEMVKRAYPDMLVGETEPYPYFSVTELEQWILALEDRGVRLAHFHIDIDPVYARDLRLDVAADLRVLSRFLQEHGIPFGVILTSDWTAAGSNRAYFESTLAWVSTVHAAIGRPQHVVFQSWQGDPTDRAHQGLHWVPINLPENDPAVYSHTRLILEGLDVFGQ